MTGVRLGRACQGARLKLVIEGEPSPEGWREDFFCEHFYPRFSMSWEGVRGQRFKYARYVDQKPAFEYLHDLQNDPNELINLAGGAEYRALLKQMRQQTDALAEDYAKALPIAYRLTPESESFGKSTPSCLRRVGWISTRAMLSPRSACVDRAGHSPQTAID